MSKVPDHLQRSAAQVKAALRAVVKDKRIGEKELAFQLGVHRMNVSHWGNREKTDRHVPAYLIPEICRFTVDFRLLDLLEDTAGRPIILVPGASGSVEIEGAESAAALTRSVRNVLQALTASLDGGLADDCEYSDAISKLNDVIYECARLQQWLKSRSGAEERNSTKPQP